MICLVKKRQLNGQAKLYDIKSWYVNLSTYVEQCISVDYILAYIKSNVGS
jgi:hypothetical protein